MKNVSLLIVLLVLMASCGSSSDRGELVGVKGKKWHSERPYGMVRIPGGAFIMGKSDDDIPGVGDAPTKTVSVPSFYMDETEITNAEYRQFVHWVRDNVIRKELAEMADLEELTPEDGGIGDFAYKDADTTDLSEYQKYILNTYGGSDNREINYDVDLILNQDDFPDELYAEVIDGFYTPYSESIEGERQWDVTKFIYNYEYIDLEKIARAKNKRSITRSNATIKEPIAVYPDTTTWIRDFEYSYNEPMHENYFSHEAYSNYPVVGVTWKQSKAFCHWRTMYKNKYQKEKNYDRVSKFRLPSEAEWEYGARGGLQGGMYPWGGPYAHNDRGCYLANFKPLRGDYAADEALYTIEADAFQANDYGLYNMAGNVSEWVESSYDPSSYEFMSTLNPSVVDAKNKRKVIRGGSWKDVAYFLKVSTRDYEYADSARSFIGFRTVESYMGTDVTANAKK